MSEFMWGLNMTWALPIIAEVLLVAAKTSNHTPSAKETQSPIRIDQVVAGTVAYGYYIAAAAMVGVQIPSFLRDHLFDGFAPAVLVGFLMYRIRDAKAELSTVLLLYLQSAAVFGLIAAAAIFTSGKDNYVPVLYAALIGGWAFPLFILAAKFIQSEENSKVAAGHAEPAPNQTAGPTSEEGAVSQLLTRDWSKCLSVHAEPSCADHGAKMVLWPRACPHK
jgi:hypothetical protein